MHPIAPHFAKPGFAAIRPAKLAAKLLAKLFPRAQFFARFACALTLVFAAGGVSTAFAQKPPPPKAVIFASSATNIEIHFPPALQGETARHQSHDAGDGFGATILQIFGTNRTSNITVTPANSGRIHTVRVRWTTGGGNSDWSQEEQIHPNSFGITRPGTPTIAVDGRAFTVSWSGSPPEDGHFRIRWAPDNGDGYRTWHKAEGDIVTASPHTITTLTPGMTYEVQVAAALTNTTGARGRGGFSGSSLPTEAEGFAPSAVLSNDGRTVTAIFSGTVPSGGDYRIRWARGGTTDWQDADGESVTPSGAATTSYTVSTLQPGVSYDVQVAAANAGGVLSEWSEVSSVTPGGFAMDLNGDSDVTIADGIIVARHLLGVTGESLVAGQGPTLASLTEQQRNDLTRNFTAGKDGGSGVLDVDADSDTDADDGILIVKYLSGFRDTKLSATGAAAIATKVQALVDSP